MVAATGHDGGSTMGKRTRLALAIAATLLVAVGCRQAEGDRDAAAAAATAPQAEAAGPAADGVAGAAPAATASDPATAAADGDTLRATAAALFGTIPERVEELRGKPLSAEQVELGHMLFFDPRLSRSHLITCNTCHSVGTRGADNLPTSTGHRWQRRPRSTRCSTAPSSGTGAPPTWPNRPRARCRPAWR